jgi:hypothetical protein
MNHLGKRKLSPEDFQQLTRAQLLEGHKKKKLDLSPDNLQLLLEGSQGLFGIYSDVTENAIHFADWETIYRSSYVKEDSDTNKPIYDASSFLSRFTNSDTKRDSLLMPSQRDSLLMPSHEFIDYTEKVTDKIIAKTNKLIDKQLDRIDKINYSKNPDVLKEFKKWPNNPPIKNYVIKTYDTPLSEIEDLYFIPSIKDYDFRLKDEAIEKLKPHVEPETRNDVEKYYTIDLRNITDDNDKEFFKKFATIPPGLENYVNDTYTYKKYEDLPTYCLVSNEIHSSLYLNIPGGIQYVIGFAPLTYNTYYNGDSVKDTYYNGDSVKDTYKQWYPEYPGRMYGIDPNYTPEDSAEESNWITAIGYITPEILERIKTMLESATLIKFKTIDNCIVDGVDACFFASTAKDSNNFSYRSKFNCFGMISYILGFTLDESNYRSFYISNDKENPPLYLKSLPHNILLNFMNSSNAEQQFNIIREIQLSHTLYNYQADVFGPSKTVDTKLKTIYHSINSLIKTILSKGGKVKRNKTKRNKTKRNKTKRNKTKRNKLHQIIT